MGKAADQRDEAISRPGKRPDHSAEAVSAPGKAADQRDDSVSRSGKATDQCRDAILCVGKAAGQRDGFVSAQGKTVGQSAAEGSWPGNAATRRRAMPPIPTLEPYGLSFDAAGPSITPIASTDPCEAA